jgi:hypothetical protein
MRVHASHAALLTALDPSVSRAAHAPRALARVAKHKTTAAITHGRDCKRSCAHCALGRERAATEGPMELRVLDRDSGLAKVDRQKARLLTGWDCRRSR